MSTTPDIDITHLLIGELKPDPFNPRRISDEEMESLTVPVVLVDLSEEQAHLLNSALNKISGS